MQDIYNELKKIIDEERIFINEPMSKHTSFKIGGPAKFFIKVKDIDELKIIKKLAKTTNLPIKIIGNGTNILVSDKGFNGIIIKLDLNEIKLKNDIIIAESGALISKLAKVALDNSLSGLESLSGIPGSIGGAVKMNAGAYGGEIKDIVIETTYLDDNLEVKTLTYNEHEFGYRKSFFTDKNYVIISTKLKLNKDDKELISKRMKEVNTTRKQKQPLDYPNAGSVFKRGEDYFPSELIEKAGLKGYNVGNAYVSEKHAGFIINKGGATATDVLQLIEDIKKKVYKEFNKKLETEIEFIGE